MERGLRIRLIDSDRPLMYGRVRVVHVSSHCEVSSPLGHDHPLGVHQEADMSQG